METGRGEAFRTCSLRSKEDTQGLQGNKQLCGNPGAHLIRRSSGIEKELHTTMASRHSLVEEASNSMISHKASGYLTETVKTN